MAGHVEGEGDDASSIILGKRQREEGRKWEFTYSPSKPRRRERKVDFPVERTAVCPPVAGHVEGEGDDASSLSPAMGKEEEGLETHLLDGSWDWLTQAGQQGPRPVSASDAARREWRGLLPKKAVRILDGKDGRPPDRSNPMVAGQWEEGKQIPTLTTLRGRRQRSPGGEGGRLPNSNSRGRPESNGGRVWRALIGMPLEDRAINGEADSSHDCYAFIVEKGNGAPAVGLEKGPIRPKMYYLWRGKSREPPCGAIRPAVLSPSVATQYGKRGLSVARGQPPASRVGTPPKLLSLLW